MPFFKILRRLLFPIPPTCVVQIKMSTISVLNNCDDGYRITGRISILLMLMATVFATMGCKPAEDPAARQQADSMNGLAICYGQYISQHRGRPPKNEKSFRKFIDAQPAAFLESFGASSADDLLVSPRDGEPYVVAYGRPAKIIAYEKTGVDGMRYVSDDLGIVKEVDEATFAELVPQKD